MASPHFSPQRTYGTPPATSPEGAIHNPSAYGIDPALAPNVINHHAQQAGHLMVQMAFSTPAVTTYSFPSYDPTSHERTAEAAADQARDAVYQGEQSRLSGIASTAPNSAVRRPASDTLARSQRYGRGKQVSAHGTPEYYERVKRTQETERKAGINPDWPRFIKRQAIKALGRGALSLTEIREYGFDQKLLRDAEVDGIRGGFIYSKRGVHDQKKERRAKKGRAAAKRHGQTEEQIAALFGSAGRDRTMDIKKSLINQKSTEYKISRKGAVIETANGRKFIVIDVEGTPVLASRVIWSYDPSSGEHKYIDDPAHIDPAEGRSRREPVYTKDESGRLVPLLRDNYLQSGLNTHVRQTSSPAIHVVPQGQPQAGKTTNWTDGPYFYADGTPIPNTKEAIDDTSFSTDDDLIVLRPLLTGEEAFNLFVNGSRDPNGNHNPNHPLLQNLYIRRSDAVSHIEVTGDLRLVEKRKQRHQAIQRHLVFTSDGTFRRFSYTDPYTSRRQAADRQWRDLAIKRQEALAAARRKSSGKRLTP